LLIIIIPAIILIFLVEGLPMLRNNLRKDMFAFVIMLGIALLLTVIDLLGFPSPIKLTGDMLRSSGKAIFR